MINPITDPAVLASRRNAKKLADLPLPADIVAAVPALVAALGDVDAAEQAYRAAEDTYLDVDMIPAEHKAEVRAAIRAGKKPPTFDAITHEVQLEEAHIARKAAEGRLREARIAYGLAIAEHADHLADLLAQQAMDAYAQLESALDAARAAFSRYGTVSNLRNSLVPQAERAPWVGPNEVVYSGPVRLGRVVDAFEILTRAMDPTNLRPAAAREAVRTTGRLK
ncbi:hypothetical protein [Micromonospora yangpuensis]|uniref:Uncharacterized protein n=1 Tax=Micromonospora yangpuensis TaxID=683228 RepID=A0A1C6U7A6_9ACTN|nr:hypothetical protein [Micromonospora yangpuensis]GGL90395.1 hypothetical protein GCM10012279_05200 [Micromonospora yangpuensis]SCL49818.1 hypothetical protein GA0070617_1295 [Micromonospora yangpuensis]